MQFTPEQATILRDAVRQRSAYFHAVKVRMYGLGIGPGDRLYDLFDDAEVAATRLVSELHDRTHGSARPFGESPRKHQT